VWSPDAYDGPALTPTDYLAVLEWTGRQLHPGKRGRITGPPPAAFAKATGVAPERWADRVSGIERDYWRAVGTVDALLERAQALGQCWLKGLGVARRLARAMDRG